MRVKLLFAIFLMPFFRARFLEGWRVTAVSCRARLTLQGQSLVRRCGFRLLHKPRARRILAGVQPHAGRIRKSARAPASGCRRRGARWLVRPLRSGINPAVVLPPTDVRFDLGVEVARITLASEHSLPSPPSSLPTPESFRSLPSAASTWWFPYRAVCGPRQ